MEWMPIETAPKDGAILMYFAKRKFRSSDCDDISMGPIRDIVERTEVGFCVDGDICESGTGHSVFEEWRGDDDRPTHWMTLPPPPDGVMSLVVDAITSGE